MRQSSWLAIAWLCCACRAAGGSALLPLPSESAAGAAPDVDGATSGGHSGGAGEPTAEPGCQGEVVSLAEVHSGMVRQRSSVVLRGLVMSSQKFLLSESKSGGCLWAAFAAHPERSGAGSGLLLVSPGDDHLGGSPCVPGTDGLPDDLAVGDVVDAPGELESFAPSACPEQAASKQLRVQASCPLVRTGRGAPPAPAVIDLPLADRLAAGTEPALLEAWGGALLQLNDVSALQDPKDGDAVFPFGVIRLEQTNLTLSSRVHYFDLTAGGPRAPAKAPRYGYPTHFADVSGVLLLDYCSWTLAPRGLLAAGR